MANFLKRRGFRKSDTSSLLIAYTFPVRRRLFLSDANDKSLQRERTLNPSFQTNNIKWLRNETGHLVSFNRGLRKRFLGLETNGPAQSEQICPATILTNP